MASQKARRAKVESARLEMPSPKKPTSKNAEEAIGRTNVEIAVQLAPPRTAAEPHRLAGSAAPGALTLCRGEKPTVVFTVKDVNGNSLSISNLSFSMTGPTSDYG